MASNLDAPVVKHQSVLYQEVLAWLQPRAFGRYIDGTVGFGGHTAGILAASTPDGRVLAFDRDSDALTLAQERLASETNRVTFVRASYSEMGTVAPQYGFTEVQGILLDLGLSSMQLDNAERGFSFRFTAPLDMRFDQRQQENASELLNNLSEEALSDLLWRYGELPHHRHLARVIVKNRPILSTTQLAELAAQHSPRHRHIHPAAQLFQAIRIAVNDELSTLEKGMAEALALLATGGRLAIISFHSLEDRLVKQTFRQWAQTCVCPPKQPICTCKTRPLVTLPYGNKAVQPTEQEIALNPRSRSARLRIAEKIGSVSS